MVLIYRKTFIDPQNASSSICPKGWRLPTGGSAGEFQILTDYYHNKGLRLPNLTYSGMYVYSSPNSQGSTGYYWSSTVKSSTFAYYLLISKSNDSPNNTTNKYLGGSVRCVQK